MGNEKKKQKHDRLLLQPFCIFEENKIKLKEKYIIKRIKGCLCNHIYIKFVP